jgi:hypothetical protein
MFLEPSQLAEQLHLQHQQEQLPAARHTAAGGDGVITSSTIAAVAAACGAVGVTRKIASGESRWTYCLCTCSVGSCACCCCVLTCDVLQHTVRMPDLPAVSAFQRDYECTHACCCYAGHASALGALIHLLRSPSRQLREQGEAFMREHYHMRGKGAVQVRHGSHIRL